ncbi:aldo/keto reductase family protein [Aspergillus lucknowensis]|uniref:D-xylose reductase [NAD(P)H] n=1 Tax=Aspergillus lucknowensis TaxID=176173 RepID=A0ABR4M1L8_9EURO
MTTPPVQLIFGGASFGGMEADFVSLADTQDALKLLQDGGIKVIDTARTYTNSEKWLGQVGAPTRFVVDTKYPGGLSPHPSSKEHVIATLDESLRLLKTDQVNVYCVHVPDRRVPLEDLLDGLNAAFIAGKFKRLGLSNFLPEEVEEVVRIAEEKNYVLPSVYQGNYNPVARHSETTLLPILRKYNISYYAYSPIAGGFLTKDVDLLISGAEEGRWNPNTYIGGMYNALYNKPRMLEGLRLWGKISAESGIPKAELAYRWVAYHSACDEAHGDSLIFGSRNGKQLQTTLAGLRNGPLSREIVEQIDLVWNTVKADAPIDNFNDTVGAK